MRDEKVNFQNPSPKSLQEATFVIVCTIRDKDEDKDKL
jgi:hypothetical protein